MKTLLIAALTLNLYATAEGHPDAFRWAITAPDGRTTIHDVQNLSVTVDDGAWKFRLYTAYLHESSFGPWPWVSVDNAYWPEPLFADDFESGNTNAWK